ncbi:hypothetical protein [Georhizobium sp. MAB10]|jgi:hypothetical protein|uniref:hypothetical protein n=1 Tax=Georhizobium sp. MAB10 TaxID=3028319 RepID=UPI003855E584
MSKIMTVAAMIAALAVFNGAAYAQCADTEANAAGAISKDGSIAPLEGAADANANAETGSVAKDGSTMPLEANEDQAMSSDDVAAQQQGEETSAAAADEACPDDAG